MKAFPDTQIIAAATNAEIIRQLLSANPIKPVGIRGDSLGVFEPPHTWAVDEWSDHVQNNDPIIQTLLNRWEDRTRDHRMD